MIKIENLTIKLPGFVLDGINLSIEDGEFFILLGPTGAGKTLALEAIAGIRPVTGGSIKVKGKDITKLAPEQRGIGIMYQDYALFPHLSVLENIKFGLRYHKSNPRESTEWIKWLMDKTGLTPLAQRSINNLSGGEKQRTALARALSVKPSLLLLDEPLSALDPNFRKDIRNVLKMLHQKVGITFLMVTHDFTEALYLGQRAAIINKGKIEQVGPVSEIFRQPATVFAAKFLGMENIFPAKISGNKAMLDGLELKLKDCFKKKKGFVAIRPENIMIIKDQIPKNVINILQGKILDATDKGPYFEISARVGKKIFKVPASKSDLFKMGVSETKDIYLGIRPSDIHVL